MTKKIYLDYQATTPVDPKILRKMIPYFSNNFGNPHSNNHQYGKLANNAVEDARKAVSSNFFEPFCSFALMAFSLGARVTMLMIPLKLSDP